MSPHLDAGRIMEAASGELDDEASHAHLDSCAECRALLEDWRATTGMFAATREVMTPKDHPSGEDLAGFAAGGGDPDGTIADHVEGCTRCASIVREALEAESEEREAGPPVALKSGTRAWQKDMALRFAHEPVKPPGPVWWQYAAVAAVVVLSLAGLGIWWMARRPSDPERLLAKAYTEARPFDFRLPDAGYGPVRQERGTSSVFDQPEALIDAEAVIMQRMKDSPNDPGALRLKGTYQLLVRDFDGAIESLTRASDAGPEDLEALADLGTAYAARGESKKQDLDFGHAMDLFSRVLKKQPDDERAVFNLALTAEKLRRVNESLETWRRFLALHRGIDWNREATNHMAALEKANSAP